MTNLGLAVEKCSGPYLGLPNLLRDLLKRETCSGKPSARDHNGGSRRHVPFLAFASRRTWHAEGRPARGEVVDLLASIGKLWDE